MQGLQYLFFGLAVYIFNWVGFEIVDNLFLLIGTTKNLILDSSSANFIYAFFTAACFWFEYDKACLDTCKE